MVNNNFIYDFQRAISLAGLAHEEKIIADGQMYRFHVQGDKPGTKNGWYFLYAEPMSAGAFGCWKRNIKEKWCGRASHLLDKSEKELMKKRIQEIQALKQQGILKKNAKAKEKAKIIWSKATPNKNHPYLVNKQISNYGLRVYNQALVIPLYDIDSILHNLQFINYKNNTFDKRFLAGAKKKGLCYLIGEITDPLYIAEGYSTGATIHEATQCGVIVAFDCGNFISVGKNIREKYPTYKLIFAADNDQYSITNPGLDKAKEAAKLIGGAFTCPNFSNLNITEKPTDFNDLKKFTSLDEVKLQIENNLQPAKYLAQNLAKTSSFIYRKMSDIQARPIHWLWQDKIARGKVTVIAGNPGLGKSQLTIYMAATVSTGNRWSDQSPCDQGNIAFLSAEDDASDTIKPRLIAAGASLDNVCILDAVISGYDKNDDVISKHFNLATDINHLEKWLNDHKDFALIIIDPISAYLGNIDSHKTSDVRGVLAPLTKLAEKYNVAIVCVSHLNKGNSGEALTRVSGSLGFVAASRATFIVAKDKEDQNKRLFLPAKNNLGSDQYGLAFIVEPCKIEDNIETSRIVWLPEKITVTADEALAPIVQSEEKTAIQEAKEFLLTMLEGSNAVPVKEIKKASENEGLTWRTINRAKELLPLECIKLGMKEGWAWKLVMKNTKDSEESQVKSMASFDPIGHLQTNDNSEPKFICTDLNKFQSENYHNNLT